LRLSSSISLLLNGSGSGRLAVRNGESSSSSSEQEREGSDERKDRDQDDDGMGDVDDVVVSAPDRVVVSVVLIVRGDGVSVVSVGVVDSVVVVSVISESILIVEEGKALSNKSGSKYDVDNAKSNQAERQETEEESVSSCPCKKPNKPRCNTEVTDEDRNNSSKPSRS